MNEQTAKKVLEYPLRCEGGRPDGAKLQVFFWPEIHWEPGMDRIELDGKFTVQQLEAFAWWMRNNK